MEDAITWQERTVKVGEEWLTVPEFLRRVAGSLERPDSVVDPELTQLRDLFLGAGLPALRAASEHYPWVQYGLRPDSSDRTGLYYFVHKPPGLRVRFQAPTSSRAELDDELRARLKAWQRAGLVAGWHPAVYEPESHLFGGPTSMRSVHRIFTADSLAWLGFHAQDRSVGPTWAISLLMVRALLDGLGVVDWEDIDVWDRVRRQAGRRLAGEAAEDGDRVAAALRRAWADPGRLWSLLHEPARDLVEEYRRAVSQECLRWEADYFTEPGAYVGPREAAAFVIIFHWNRADLTAVRQALIAEALTARDGREASS